MMLISYRTPSFGAFADDADFRCDAATCVAINTRAQERFEALQIALNRFVTAGRLFDFQGKALPPLVVDGKLDAKTAAAVTAAGSVMNVVTPIAESGYQLKTALTALAQDPGNFTAELNAFPLSTPPSSHHAQLPDRRWPWIVAGVVIAATGVGVVMYRRRRR
jgi:hypothetical protein